MTTTIPSYLRVHFDQEHSDPPQTEPNRDSIHDFWNAYADATGWRIDNRTLHNDAPLVLHPAVTVDSIKSIESEPDTAVSRMVAMRLAESAAQLERRLEQNRQALRRQEIELASRAPILLGESDQTRLADRIEQTLADAATACGCNAAAMYMLDDDTQYLKTRSVFGLPPQRLEEQPRPLRGSRSDLEAMVQGVVAIDDLQDCSIDTWNCPEPVAAGICAVIQSDDVPIGTLWLFRNDRARFGAAEAAAARLAASQLSLLLSLACPDRNRSIESVHEPIRDVAQWQHEALPVGAELAAGWRVDGMIESPRPWATGWHMWDILPDGTLILAIAEAVDPSLIGAMNAAIARAALAAHTGYRHSPGQLLQRVSDTLWQTSTGEQLVSMLYLQVDPETGEGEVASSGTITAMIGNRYGFRPLVDGSSEPLNTHIDARCTTKSFRMMPGETLLGYNRGIVTEGATQTMLGEGIRTAMQSSDSNPLARIRRTLANLPLHQERDAVTLLRQ